MSTRDRENQHVNEQLQRMALARELVAEYPEVAMGTDTIQDALFESYDAGGDKAREDTKDEIKNLEATHLEEIEAEVEERIREKLHVLRARCANVENLAKVGWRTRAKARLWDIHNAAGKPLKLTAAQKRSEIWQLRQELKAALERLTALEHAETTDAPLNVIRLRAGS